MKKPFRAPPVAELGALRPAEFADTHRATADAVNREALAPLMETAMAEMDRAAALGRYSTAVNITGDHLAEAMQGRLTRAGYSVRIQGRLLIISWA